VTTVVPPADAMPLTAPFPAVIDVETPPPPRPARDELTAQLPFGPELEPVTTARLEPPELLTLAELLALCAEAIDAPRQTAAPRMMKFFTTTLL
jgi:hypothetical protein